MTDADGGFYSAEDADSEGREGTFYIWEPKQISSVLDKSHAEIFNAYYGVTEKGNFEEGKTILNVSASIEQLGKKFNKSSKEIESILKAARIKIFEDRKKRPRPHLDDKVITAWNGLMISSLAYGGMILQEQKYINAAERSAGFVLRTLRKDSRLMRYYRNKQVVEKAFLDDYAFMIMALLDLYEAIFEAKWLVEAKKLSDDMIELFADTRQGGFFLTGKDSEKLIARTRNASDGAIPSGNSMAALALLKLGSLTTEDRFSAHAEKTLESFSGQLQQSPAYSSVMLTALDFWLGPRQEIVIAGRANAEDTKQMLRLIRGKFLPNSVVILHEPGRAGAAIEQVIAFVKNQVAADGKATAYVCENYVCNRPVNSLNELKALLSEIEKELKSSN